MQNIETKMQNIAIKNKIQSSYKIVTRKYKIEVIAGTVKLSIPP